MNTKPEKKPHNIAQVWFGFFEFMGQFEFYIFFSTSYSSVQLFSNCEFSFSSGSFQSLIQWTGMCTK